MIVTTSNTIETRDIVMYKDIVFGETITGVNFVKDFAAGIRNVFGGRARGYENDLIAAREKALEEMKTHAEELGANAIIAVHFDYQVLEQGEHNMMMVTCQGTAVIVK